MKLNSFMLALYEMGIDDGNEYVNVDTGELLSGVLAWEQFENWYDGESGDVFGFMEHFENVISWFEKH